MPLIVIRCFDKLRGAIALPVAEYALERKSKVCYLGYGYFSTNCNSSDLKRFCHWYREANHKGVYYKSEPWWFLFINYPKVYKTCFIGAPNCLSRKNSTWSISVTNTDLTQQGFLHKIWKLWMRSYLDKVWNFFYVSSYMTPNDTWFLKQTR